MIVNFFVNFFLNFKHLVTVILMKYDIKSDDGNGFTAKDIALAQNRHAKDNRNIIFSFILSLDSIDQCEIRSSVIWLLIRHEYFQLPACIV